MALLAGLTALFAAPVRGQTNHTAAPVDSKRYLLIVETSRSMHSRTEGTLRAVRDLLRSSMHGELHPGDSLAVWTFNSSLYTGQLPLQEWEIDTRSEVAGRIMDFIKSQHYEKKGQLEKVIPSMIRVVKSSELITVVLITDGTEEIHGTPFDNEINDNFKAWSAKKVETKTPLVTVLRAQHGHFTGHKVTPALWAVEMPPLPKEPPIAKAESSKNAHSLTAKPAPAPVVPPLIVSGRKAEPTPPSIRTDFGTAKAQQAPAVPAVEPPRDSKSESVSSVLSSLTSPGSTNVTPLTLAASGTTAEKPTMPVAQSLTPIEHHEKKAEPETALSVAEASTASSAILAPKAAELPAEAHASTPEASIPSTREFASMEAAAAQIPQPQIAIAAPGPASVNTTAITILGLVGIAATCSVFWFWKRRSHSIAHVSLITRSFDREQQ